MLPRRSALRSHLNSLYSVFTQAAPLTRLSSVFTKTPGGVPLLPQAAFREGPASMRFPPQLSNLPTFNVQTELVFSITSALFLGPRLHFQQVTHSFECRARVFNNLHTLCNVKFRLTLTESIIPALFRKNIGGYGYVVDPDVGDCSNASNVPTFQRSVMQTFRRSEWGLFRRLKRSNVPTLNVQTLRSQRRIFPGARKSR